MNPNKVTSPERLQARERAIKAIQLRKMGLTYDQIATQCGYKNRHGAIMAVRRLLQRLEQEPANEYRCLELERLEALESVLAPRIFPQKDPLTGKAPAPDYRAMDRLLAVKHMKYRLMGIYAPTKLETEVPGGDAGQFDDAKSEFLARVANIAERRRMAVRVVGSGTGSDTGGAEGSQVPVAGIVGPSVPVAPTG